MIHLMSNVRHAFRSGHMKIWHSAPEASQRTAAGANSVEGAARGPRAAVPAQAAAQRAASGPARPASCDRRHCRTQRRSGRQVAPPGASPSAPFGKLLAGELVAQLSRRKRKAPMTQHVCCCCPLRIAASVNPRKFIRRYYVCTCCTNSHHARSDATRCRHSHRSSCTPSVPQCTALLCCDEDSEAMLDSHKVYDGLEVLNPKETFALPHATCRLAHASDA